MEQERDPSKPPARRPSRWVRCSGSKTRSGAGKAAAHRLGGKVATSVAGGLLRPDMRRRAATYLARADPHPEHQFDELGAACSERGRCSTRSGYSGIVEPLLDAPRKLTQHTSRDHAGSMLARADCRNTTRVAPDRSSRPHACKHKHPKERAA